MALMMEMDTRRRSEIAGQLLCTDLDIESAITDGIDWEQFAPSRTKRTPDHKEGSPGVMVT